jgi:hypothetical protein
MSQTVFEKLQLKDERNILIQGLPSTIEKQFTKLSFAKNITPLLKIRRVDFALIFALNQKQLNDILQEVVPFIHDNGRLWVAFPKASSKIVSDLNRCCTWAFLTERGYQQGEQVVLDYVWTAMNFTRPSLVIEEVAPKELRPLKTKRKVQASEDAFAGV